MIVRLLLWSLTDSKTSLEELRRRLEPSPNRFGVLETWDDEPEEFPRWIVDLIGKQPEIAEEFDVES